MKTNTFIFSILFGLLAVCRVHAEKEPNYTVEVFSDTIRTYGTDKVKICFSVDLGEYVISGQHKRIITPIICTPDRKKQICLPAMIINGRKRSIKELRDGNLQEPSAGEYITLNGNKKENRIINYRAETDYTPWMEDAQILLRHEVIGCASCGLLEEEYGVSNSLLYKPEFKVSPEMECPNDFVQRKIRKDAFLIYPVNQTVLYPERYGNERELEKIDSAINYVRFNPDYEIRHIDIAGFASPEGSYKHNIKLAEGRAEALKKYITKYYPYISTPLNVVSGAENWDGLKSILSASQLPHKEKMLSIIDSIDSPDRREEAIKSIDNGRTYQTLLTTVFPVLRKNTFTISYISKERTPEDARRLAFSQPQELNAYEFYNVAHRFYADDTETYRRLLLIAADTYPENSIVCNNAAAICLSTGDYNKAEKYLSQTANEPFTWNNRAYLFWMTGRKEEAKVWWEKAAGNGDTIAEYNLQELGKR